MLTKAFSKCQGKALEHRNSNAQNEYLIVTAGKTRDYLSLGILQIESPEKGVVRSSTTVSDLMGRIFFSAHYVLKKGQRQSHTHAHAKQNWRGVKDKRG